VIALRAAMLLATVALVAAAQHRVSPIAAPAAAPVFVGAVAALLSPLFWPGCAATPAQAAARVLGWSSISVACAAIVAWGFAPGPLSRSANLLAMLWLVVAVVLAAAALIEVLLVRRGARRPDARHASATAAALLLATLGALPLWLGPAADLLSSGQPWLLDAVVGLSPLTHLAIAGDNDLLRNDWFYQHSTLAGLPFSYPSLGVVVAGYALAGVALLAGAMRTQRPTGSPPSPPDLDMEPSR
jgi:hypothetical protein